MDARIKHARSLCLMIVLCLSLALNVQAQSSAVLEPNIPVNGQLAAGDSTTYQFVSRNGAMLSFHAQAIDPTLDPILTITTLDGITLISNDDAGNNSGGDAVIEGFTAPRNGTYRITISSFGETSAGEYRLTMQPGYASLKTADSFSSNPVWQTLLLNTGDTLMDVDTSEGNIRMTLTGADQTGIVSSGDANAIYRDFYARVQANLTWRSGWVAGLTLRHVDELNYYLFEINSDARWRFVAVENGNERVIEDWSPHPALTVRPQFTLGALANNNVIELFYQDELLGTMIDDSMGESGRIGFYAGTDSRATSQIEARFDNLIITEPITFDDQGVFPEQILVSNGEMTVRELQRRRLIPGGGAMAAENLRGTVQDTIAGISRIEMIPGSYRNFILGGTVYWSTTGSEGVGGCGLAFRENDALSTYLLAYVDSSGAYGLAQRQPETFEPGIFQEAVRPPERLRNLVIVALADRLYLYVDGKFVEGDYSAVVGSMTEAGGISRAVVNFDAVKTVCDFQGGWLWSMD